MNDVPLTRRRLLTAAGVVVGMTSLGTLSVAGEAGPVKPSVNGVIERLNQSVMLLQTTEGRQLVQIHEAAFNRDGAASHKAFMPGDEVVAELQGAKTAAACVAS